MTELTQPNRFGRNHSRRLTASKQWTLGHRLSTSIALPTSFVLRASLTVGLLIRSQPVLAQAVPAQEKESPPATDSASSLADEAFTAGVAAYRRGDYQSARESFTRAYELDASYRSAAVLGQTEEKLGNLAQAATLLNWALFHMDANHEPEAKARMNADLTLLRNRILTVNLVTTVPFQEVLIDDLLFSSNSLRVLPAGDNTWTIYLDTASHQIVVRSDGYQPQERKITEPAGTLIDWELRWQHARDNTDAPTKAPLPSTPIRPTELTRPTSLPPHEDTVHWQLPTAITTGSLAVLSAGFGFYSLHEYSRASDDLDAARNELLSTGTAQPCGPGATASTQPTCGSMATAADAQVTYGNRAIGVLSAAGALALTSTVLWLWWWKDGDAGSNGHAWNIAPAVNSDEWRGVATYSF